MSDLGANGILGVGSFAQDCGVACTSGPLSRAYYTCQSSPCQPANAALAQQVSHPGTAFAFDNDGVVLALPAVPTQGAATVTGTLTFGIGTQPNNGLGRAVVLSVDRNSGSVTTLLGGGGIPYSNSCIDSGSNALYFSDSTNANLVTCATNNLLCCPATTLTLTATNVGANGAQSTVAFSVVAADPLFQAQPRFAAFGNIAGPNRVVGPSPSSDWGLPFFSGRTVFVAVEGARTPGGTGPYVAY